MNRILLTATACALPFLAMADSAPSKWESANTLANARFASLAKADDGFVVVMRGVGERYLCAVGQSPAKPMEYGQRIAVPAGSRLVLTGKHSVLSLDLITRDGSSLIVMVERGTPPTGDPVEVDAVGKIATDGSLQDLEESKGRPIAEEADLAHAVKDTVSRLVRLAAEAKSRELQDLLTTPDPAALPRHSATPESLRRYFEGVDFQKIEYSLIRESREEHAVFVRLGSPRQLDLEFTLVSRDPWVLRLRSAHP